MIKKQEASKTLLSKELGISRASLYYVSKQIPKDWALKEKIEEVLGEQPGYGYRRVANHLKQNKKRIQRVMRLYGLRAYRRRGKKPRKSSSARGSYPNLLSSIYPTAPHYIWVSDFTAIPWKMGFIYLATVLDLFTREVVGWSLQINHATSLIIQAFYVALHRHSPPKIFHSDNGREYGAKAFTDVLLKLNVHISRSAPASPWQNGYQEAFYSQFKVDLGDPNRFKVLGELVAEVCYLVWNYNHRRIHSVLKMPPLLFAERYQKLLQKVS